jgi:hypothetical protein
MLPFIHDFYLARFDDLTAIRTSPEYDRFRQVLSNMGDTPRVTADDVADARLDPLHGLPEFPADWNEIFEDVPIRDLFTQWESDFWRDLLQTVQKIRRAATSDITARDADRPTWRASDDDAMRALGVYLVLLRKYAPMITLELDRRFGALPSQPELR